MNKKQYYYGAGGSQQQATNPCNQCPNRKVGCHGSCQAYKEWKRQGEIAKAKEVHSKAYYAYLSGIGVDTEYVAQQEQVLKLAGIKPARR